MGQVGWGVIGCSDIVERRAGEAIRQQGSSRLVAFHSRDLARAEAFATTFGAPTAYDDLDRLLGDERIDAVYIATEVDRHAPLTIAAAEAGKHILVEKPMALTGAECEEMIDAAARHGVRLAVAYYARFFQKAAVIHDLIAGGGLGRVVRATVTQIGYQNPDPADPKYWRVTGRGGGNILADVGSHRIDLLTYWLGPPGASPAWPTGWPSPTRPPTPRRPWCSSPAGPTPRCWPTPTCPAGRVPPPAPATPPGRPASSSTAPPGPSIPTPGRTTRWR